MMDYEEYFSYLYDKYQCGADINLLVSNTKLFEPIKIAKDTMIIDLTRPISYYSAIEQFFISKVIEHMHIVDSIIEIKNITVDDAKDYFEICSNPNICNPDASVLLTSVYEVKERIMNSSYIKGIFYNTKLIGTISFISDKARAVPAYEIGYCINENYWNQGFGSRMLELVIEFIKERTPIMLLSARVLIGNDRSSHLLEKFGFIHEGIRRCSVYHPMTNMVVDAHVYSLLLNSTLDLK